MMIENSDCGQLHCVNITLCNLFSS